MEIDIILNKIEKIAKLKKPKIAVGLSENNKEILKSLEKGKKYSNIILVGPDSIKNIKKFELVISNDPEEKIISMLAKKEVDGILRGTLDMFEVYDCFQKITKEKSLSLPVFMEIPDGKKFFLVSASNTAAWDKNEKFKMTIELVKLMRRFDIRPKIAVLAAERHQTYYRKRQIKKGLIGYLNKTYRDANWLVNKFEKSGFEAKNLVIDVDKAIKGGYNIILPVNGMVGNQIFRVVLFCGGKNLATPRLGLSYAYEENSRNETDLLFHVKWLAAMINSGASK